MERWNAEHRAFACETYFRKNDSYVETIRAFRKKFALNPRDPVPSRNTLNLWVRNFRETASAGKKKPPGLARSVRTPENAARVQNALVTSPTRSARKQASSLGVSRTSFRRILRDLSFHPYKILITQELKPTDYGQRLKFAQTMKRKLQSGEIERSNLLISDEAHFHLNEFVNKQNCRYYAVDHPKLIHEKPLHSPRVTVWCAVAEWGIVGPYFFEGNVNTESYTQMLHQFLIPELKRRRKLKSTIFQQDGATCHTSKITMAMLRRVFGTRLISRFTKFGWPPRSPDMSTCDFFLWGYLKSRVYVTKPRTLEQLKTNIRREIGLINKAMLKRVYENFEKRLEDCIETEGHHLTGVIFRT